MSTRLDHSRDAKIEKRKKLESLGINVHPPVFAPTHALSTLADNLQNKVVVAGRIMQIRQHGKVTFLTLQDTTGSVQIICKQEDLNQQYEYLIHIDVGDHLGVEGEVIHSNTGELSIAAQNLTILSKSLRPLPHSWQGLEDQEVRYRKRYLDMLINPDVKKLLDNRWLIEKQLRRYLQDEQNFVEVETPILQPLYGGTNAKPFTTHMNALDCDFYLRLAPELYLKRLIVGGYERIFEIARNFRNEGIDQTHQPEFTMVEWYEAYADYQRMMDVTEGLFKHLVKAVHGGSTLQVGDHAVDVGKPWPRIAMKDALKQFENITVDDLSDAQLQALLKEKNIELTGQYSRGKAIFSLFDHTVTKKLISPTWIIDYPKEVSPLSKQHRLFPDTMVERFEGYIGGKEICDGWSEVTDALEQRRRFEVEQQHMRDGDDEAQPTDEEFLEAMEYGMPPLGGIGIGIDRLVMFLTNTWSIKEVIAFPTLRPLQKMVTQPETKSSKVSYVLDSTNSISKEVSTKFPGMFYGWVKISGVRIKKSDANLKKFVDSVLASRQALTVESVKELEPVKAYRNLLKTTGVDVSSNRPSPEALLRRIAQKKGIYTINTAVDAYNASVVESGVGLGGFDASALIQPISLRFSKKGETMHLLGDSEPTELRDGQLIYADANQPITMDLNYRDIDSTKITESTKDILLFADGAPELDVQNVMHALKNGAEYIQKYCGGTIEQYYVVKGESTPTSQTTDKLPPRTQAEELLHSHIKNQALVQHCLLVAKGMEAYAKQLGEDAELWYQAGLLHDLDWEEFPVEHPNKALAEWLSEYPASLKQAVASHAPERTGTQPTSLLDKYLFACDELSGFIWAASLMRPEKLNGMEVKSVTKKMKDKGFAKNVSREDIAKGAELINKTLDEHISFLIQVFQQ